MLGTKVGAHQLDVVHREAEMAHHIGRIRRRFVEQLDVLMIVDLDKRDADILTVLLREGVGLVEAQEVVPEGDCLGQVGDEIGDVRDAGDSRTLGR